MIWSRPRRFPAVLCGILWAVLLSSAESKVDESVIRTAHSSYVNKGETLRQYSDGRDVVVVIFNENSDILECHVTKSDVNGTRNLFNQAVQNPLSEVQYLFQDDVAKMGRRCRKLMRDIVSPVGYLFLYCSRGYFLLPKLGSHFQMHGPGHRADEQATSARYAQLINQLLKATQFTGPVTQSLLAECRPLMCSTVLWPWKLTLPLLV